MAPLEIEEKYKKMGLKTMLAKDEPGKTYAPHSHHATWLYSLSGSVKVRLDGKDWKEIKPGEEVVIKDGQLHEAIVGSDGWQYIFAYPKDTEPFSYEDRV